MNFKTYQLQDFLYDGLTRMGISEPTPIQQQVIPLALRGESIIGQSQTGSGKTHAFLLPLLNMVDAENDAVQVLITAPSRELATQIYRVATTLAEGKPELRVQLFVGGSDKLRQIGWLQNQQPHVAIGTPGRLLDLIQSQALLAHTVTHFVVDEADMTLDMGFLADVDKIASLFGDELQMMVFSATIPPKLEPFLRRYMQNPAQVIIKPAQVIADTVANWLLPVDSRDKNQLIYRLLTMGSPFLALIFANTKESVDQIATYLKNQGLAVAKIHGDVPPRERKRVMKAIADLKYQYVVATDLAARGIDIEGVSLVINAEIPRDYEFFIHRVGRTGRQGMAGTAITLYEPGQEAAIAELEHRGIRFVPKKLEGGRLVDGNVRNRRQARKPKTEERSLAIRGLAKKVAKKKKPGYKKKIQAAIADERRRNNRVKRREELRASRKAKKQGS